MSTDFAYRLTPDAAMSLVGVREAINIYTEKSEGAYPTLLFCGLSDVEYAHKAVQELQVYPWPRVIGLAGLPRDWWMMIGKDGFIWSWP